MTRSMSRRVPIALTAAVAFVAAGCGSSNGNTQPTSTPAPATISPATATAGTTTSPATSGAGTGSDYASTSFTVPFDVTVPAWLGPVPTIEQPRFVTWESPSADRAVRFLVPVNVYPPGGSGPVPPPADYVDYLLAQAAHGAHFTDEAHTTVGGKPTTIVTATVDDGLDGSLGCPDTDVAAADCFGLQPELALRIAVIDTGDTPLLIWLRGKAGTATDNESFANLLSTVRFSDRPVQAPATAVATRLDGIYHWTLSKDDARTHGTPDDRTPEALAHYPAELAMTLTDGHWTLTTGGTAGPVEGSGTYRVDGDEVKFEWGGNVLTFAFTVDADGTLHLDPLQPIDSGDAFVWATEPWTKIAG